MEMALFVNGKRGPVLWSVEVILFIDFVWIYSAIHISYNWPHLYSIIVL